MSALKLDRNKPFAQVFGDTEGRHFQQGDNHFKQDGSLWRDPKKKETPEEKAERERAEKEEADRLAAEVEAQKKADAAAGGNDAQLAAQLSTASLPKA